MPGPWKKLDLLAAALPFAVAASLLGAPAWAQFLLGALAVVPLAGLIGRSTEALTTVVGGSIGALLNATFGNFAELAIAGLLVLRGEVKLVQASIVGSLVGNLLLLLGVVIVVSTYDQRSLEFARSSRVQSTMLFLAVGIFLLPTLFSFRRESTGMHLDEISDGIAVVLFLLYGLALLFMFRTHVSVFRGGDPEEGEQPEPEAEEEEAAWSPKAAVAVLAGATVLVAIAAEIVSGSVEEAGGSLGLTTGFLGFIVLPLVGNAAEQFSGITLAAKDRLDVAADIAVSASIQLVLFAVPVLVLVGALAGHPFRLVFDPFELAVLVVGTLLVRQLVDDNRSHWFEGAMLLGLYLAFAASAFFVTL